MPITNTTAREQQQHLGRVVEEELQRAAQVAGAIHRQGGDQGFRNAPAAPYNCKFAQQRYERRRRYSRPQSKLAPESTLFKQVCRLLRRLWSPEQIAGHLATVHGTDQSQRVSHETIYTCIYAQPKGELRRELIACLRMARAKRWPRSRGTDRRGEIADLLSIHVRPPQINERQFPGHWEGDLIKGAGNLSAVGTLVERSSRLLMLAKLPPPSVEWSQFAIKQEVPSDCLSRHKVAHMASIVKAHLAGQRHALAQALAGALHARLGCAQAQARVAGVLGLRHALQVALGDGLTILRAQFGEHTRQAGCQRFNRVGLVDGRAQVVGQVHSVARHAQAIGQGVARHREQPGAGVVHRAEALPLAQRLEKQVLQQVIDLGGIGQPVACPTAKLGLVLAPGGGQAIHRKSIQIQAA
jgi:IS30 family transposase